MGRKTVQWAESEADRALELAIERDDVEGARRALDAGASTECATRKLVPFLQAAARRCGPELVGLLLERRSAAGHAGIDPAVLFASLRRADGASVLALLVAAGADVQHRSHDKTAVMTAAEHGALESAKLLVQWGVDPHATDPREDVTALDLAVKGRHRDVAAWLRDLGVPERAAARNAFTKSLVEAWRAKATPCSGAVVLIDPPRGDVPFQVRVSRDRHRLVTHDLRFRDPLPATVTVLGEAVALPKGARLVEGAHPRLGLRVATEAPASLRTDDVVRRILGSVEDDVESLRLGSDECLVMTSSSLSVLATGLDAASALERRTVIERLVARTCRTSAPPASPFEGPLAIRAAKRDASTSHRLGGPHGAGVAYPDCGSQLLDVLGLDLDDPRLAPLREIAPHGYPVPACFDCCFMDPILLDLSTTPVTGLDNEHELEPEDLADLGDVPEETAIVLEPASKGARDRSRLGGEPSWLQPDATPSCPKCREPMAFVLQLASSSTVSFGEGTLYSFACPPCRASATLVQMD